VADFSFINNSSWTNIFSAKNGARKLMPRMFRFNRIALISTLAIFFGILLAACSGQADALPSKPSNTNSLTPAPISAAISPTAPVSTPNSPAAPSSGVSFSKDVLPLLQSTCVSCHGGARTSRGLDLTNYNNVMAGSQNGPVIIAGNADGSLLIQSVKSGTMPKSGSPLTADQIKLLVDWTNAGANNN
jgi:hypothetical protein